MSLVGPFRDGFYIVDTHCPPVATHPTIVVFVSLLSFYMWVLGVSFPRSMATGMGFVDGYCLRRYASRPVRFGYNGSHVPLSSCLCRNTVPFRSWCATRDESCYRHPFSHRGYFRCASCQTALGCGCICRPASIFSSVSSLSVFACFFFLSLDSLSFVFVSGVFRADV